MLPSGRETMDDTVSTPPRAETDTSIYSTSTPNVSSVTDADKVINTQIDSSPKVEGDKSEEELLKGHLTDTYCHLCDAVLLFESQKLSHYEGKKHAQRVQAYLQTKRALKSNKLLAAPQQTMPTDKNRLCELCNKVFNSDQVANSHYEGKVHAKNLRKKGLLPPANSLMCQICKLQFNSAENYQAHIDGNKHQIRQRKIKDVCKSKQKVYNTFADELADYIQAQKARGLTPKTCEVQEDDEVQKNNNDLNTSMPNFIPPPDRPHHSHPCYNSAGGWAPPHQGPVWPHHSWDYNYYSPPVLPQVSRPSLKRRRHRKQSRSSSYSTSSSDSLSSSSSSDSSVTSDSEHDQRQRRGMRKSKKGPGEGRGRKRLRRGGGDEKMRRKREVAEDLEQERRREKRRKWRQKDKTSKDGVIVEGEEGEGARDTRQIDEVQTELNVGEEEEDDSDKHKNRKEKKKEKEDTRTEEEKLWDDSILGF